MAGDAQTQLVGGLPGRDRRSPGNDDRQHLRGDGDGEEEQRETDDLPRAGAVGGDVDDATDHERSRQHERRADRHEHAENDPTPRVGSQQRQEGARARRRRDPHGGQFPRRCRSGRTGLRCRTWNREWWKRTRRSRAPSSSRRSCWSRRSRSTGCAASTELPLTRCSTARRARSSAGARSAGRRAAGAVRRARLSLRQSAADLPQASGRRAGRRRAR